MTQQWLVRSTRSDMQIEKASQSLRTAKVDGRGRRGGGRGGGGGEKSTNG